MPDACSLISKFHNERDAPASRKLLLNKHNTKVPWLAPIGDNVTVVVKQQGNDCVMTAEA